jgi:hypothetical protein
MTSWLWADRAHAPALLARFWIGMGVVGVLDAGLTCYSADAAGCIRIDLSAGPRFFWQLPALPV